MSGGLGIWGGTPWGGAPLSTPSTLSGVVKLDPINIEPGTAIQFPAATAALNGKSVTTPFAIDEPGYYELFVETSPVIIQPITCVDLDDITVQVLGFGFTNDGLQSYQNMVNALPRVYGHGLKSIPRYSGSNYCLDVVVSRPVTLLTRLVSRNSGVQDIGKTVAPTAGRYRSSPFEMPPGQVKIQAVVQVENSPYNVPIQHFVTINNPVGAISTVNVPALAAGFVATSPPSATTVSNSVSFDKNAYSASGVAGYSTNFQAVQRTAFAGLPTSMVSISATNTGGTFKMASMSGVTTVGGIEQVCISKNTGDVDGWVTPIILNALSGVVKYGVTWRLPPNASWYLPRTTWPTNPFTGQLWSPADIGSDKYRFGLFRDPSGAAVDWQALIVAPQGVI